VRRSRYLSNQGILAISLVVLVIGFYIGSRLAFSEFSLLQSLYYPFGKPLSYIKVQFGEISWYFSSLSEEIEKNNRLEVEIKNSQLLLHNYEELIQENIRLRKLLNANSNPGYKRKVTSVIGKSPDIWHKEIIIDIGKKDQVKVDYPVIDSWGLVGRIKKVNEFSSVVQLLVDNSNWVSTINNRSRSVGMLKSESITLGKIHFLVNKSDFKKGDFIFTSGLGGLYPKGIPIGMVERVSLKAGDDIPEVSVEYLVDFDNLEEVIVLMPENKSEKAL